MLQENMKWLELQNLQSTTDEVAEPEVCSFDILSLSGDLEILRQEVLFSM